MTSRHLRELATRIMPLDRAAAVELEAHAEDVARMEQQILDLAATGSSVSAKAADLAVAAHRFANELAVRPPLRRY